MAENGAAPSGALRVAAAADLKFAMEVLIDQFGRQNPTVPVRVTYGSSGNFYSQLLNRAPYDLYFSADIFYPQKLLEQDLALKDSFRTYAVGRMALWTREDSHLDLDRLGISALTQPQVRRIAIANPRHAPYGRAAEAVLRHFGVYQAVQSKLIYGENVVQAAQFVDAGAAQLGVIALSLALAPRMQSAGRHWEIPPTAYPRMEQGAVILKWAQDPVRARLFLAFVTGAEGRRILKDCGFDLPGG